MVDKGSVTTDDLNSLGYNHPPRAIADVRDFGIPVLTERDRTSDGRLMARYRLGRAEDIQEDRHEGRTALPKSFKAKLLLRYGSADCITGSKLDPRLLQIDHRIPYRIGGDLGLAERDVEAYMLLDASSQRAKSWSCEQCDNFLRVRDPILCKSCFWASPEAYKHIAMEQQRRTDIIWSGSDVLIHDRLQKVSTEKGISIAIMLKRMARKILSK